MNHGPNYIANSDIPPEMISSIDGLCKAAGIKGVIGYMHCLESNPRGCEHAVPFGMGYFCKCSTHINNPDIAKHVQRYNT